MEDTAGWLMINQLSYSIQDLGNDAAHSGLGSPTSLTHHAPMPQVSDVGNSFTEILFPCNSRLCQ